MRGGDALLIPAILTVLTAGVASAQDSGTFVAVGYGNARLGSPGDRFDAPTANVASLVGGWAAHRGAFGELRVTTGDAEVTEFPVLPGSEAPLTLGVEYRMVDAVLGWRVRTLALGAFRPRASIGATWARVEDTWQSDTPESRATSSALGVVGALGVELLLAPRLSLGTEGVWRHLSRRGDHPPRHIGVDGLAWELRLTYWL